MNARPGVFFRYPLYTFTTAGHAFFGDLIYCFESVTAPLPTTNRSKFVPAEYAASITEFSFTNKYRINPIEHRI